ncbi:proline racemase family protein [Streptacidiphilus rugosus]|uniref:proline racemase family protein n=1 Tax=Streptacidiphilus rugosus TaxID=405783 RepID=UPI00055D3EC5|nr:proline racemase family protein [Streptacidiphilus rugosus]
MTPAPRSSLDAVDCVDYHTAGEPFRIVPFGTVPVPGDTVAERRAIALGPDGRPRPGGAMETVRQLLCREPRGHADMYGGFLTPPDDDGAHLGVLFWHKDGFSTACGHGTMALGAWAVDSGLVAAPDEGEVVVRIDVPSGRVEARVRRSCGRTRSVTFRNVPARVAGLAVRVETADFGVVEVDVAHAGACYAVLPAAALGLEPSPEALPELIRAGRQVRAALAGHAATREPRDPRLSGVYGVLLHDRLPDRADAALALRSVTVFADGQVDRSPCGSGTSALLAVLTERGRLDAGAVLHHASVIGSVFTARVAGTAAEGLVTEVTGTAHRTGVHRFELDPADALGTGFVLR